jgi:general secretion pathway protein K
LLTALIIVTVVTTLAASMIWQQWRAIQVETAERARTQATWILNGAQDWARLILREDSPAVDHLSEPWALPLAEARLSTFLAADRENTEGGPEAFLSGRIEDAQALYNLRNLIDDSNNQIKPEELRTLLRLCEAAGVAPSIGTLIANRLQVAMTPEDRDADEATPLLPQTYSQMGWLGIDEQALVRLERYVTLLPDPTTVNVNTAPAEVLAAVFNDASTSGRLLNQRPFKGTADLGDLPKNFDQGRIGIQSEYFFITGRLRLEDRVVEERSLVQRRGRDVVPMSRKRLTLVERTN